MWSLTNKFTLNDSVAGNKLVYLFLNKRTPVIGSKSVICLYCKYLGCRCCINLGKFFFFCNQGQVLLLKFKKDHFPIFFLFFQFFFLKKFQFIILENIIGIRTTLCSITSIREDLHSLSNLFTRVQDKLNLVKKLNKNNLKSVTLSYFFLNFCKNVL